MKQNKNTYGMPNLGCLLGVAYQREYSSLDSTLKDERLDITAPEYLVMRVLYNQEGLQICEIGDVLGKDKGAISRCVGSLVRKGLIRTESISHKCLRSYLTPKGEELRAAVMKVASMRESSLAEILSDDEMKQLNTILTKIINS